VVTSAISALGIDNSASHTELKITSEGPKILEIGARGGGDFISSYLTLSSTGVSMDEAIIKVALGEEPDLVHKTKLYSYIRYFSLPVGAEVLCVEDFSDILNEKGVVFAYIAVKKGDVIEKITESKKRPGFLIIKGSKEEDVIQKGSILLSKLASKIKLRI